MKNHAADISLTAKGLTVQISFALDAEALLREHLASVFLLQDSDSDPEVCDQIQARLLSVLPELLDLTAARLQREILLLWNIPATSPPPEKLN